MVEKHYYYCIKCFKEHDLDSKIGKRHYPQYIPLFAGVYTKPQEETKLRKEVK